MVTCVGYEDHAVGAHAQPARAVKLRTIVARRRAIPVPPLAHPGPVGHCPGRQVDPTQLVVPAVADEDATSASVGEKRQARGGLPAHLVGVITR
eukprot:scaffold76973_cov38-Phaeocystis_antarctica.AAC.1